jgi:hypothetical protein
MMPEFAAWDSFYVIIGSAAGALIGLQFVVMTLIAEKPSVHAEVAGAAFASPTIVHFSAVLFLAALLRAPWWTIAFPAVIWGALGFSGIVYEVIVARRMRKQRAYQPVLEDWLFHVALPSTGYTILAGSSITAISHAREALFGAGAAALLLLFTGIHNAWDGATHHVLVRSREIKSERREKDMR